MRRHSFCSVKAASSRLANVIARRVEQETCRYQPKVASSYLDERIQEFSNISSHDTPKKIQQGNTFKDQESSSPTTQKTARNKSMKQLNDIALQSVKDSFQNLDRLVEDQATNPQNPPVISAELISKTLSQWQTWQGQSRQTEDWNTDAVVTKIWDYQHHLPQLALWNRKSYNIILNGYRVDLQRKSEAALKQAKAFMERILAQLQQGGPGETPNTHNFEAFLRLYILGRDLHGAMQVLDYLLLQKRQPKEEDRLNLKIRFDVVIFQDLLQACVNDPLPPKCHRGMIADEFLQKMHQFERHNLLGFRPATEHYTQVLTAWTKSQDPRSSQRAMQIWNHLKEQSRKHPRRSLRPDSVLAGAVTNALVKTGQFDQAEAFLNDLIQKDGLGTNRVGINSLLFGLAKSQAYNAGERAEQILRTMQQEWSRSDPSCKPDATTYTAVIHAWGMSGHPSGIRKAEELFEEMTALAETDPNLEPHERTYGCLLHAYARVGDVTKASQLLGTICSDYVSGKNTKVVPNNQMFGILLNAVAKSDRPESGKVGEELLRQMEQSGIPTLSPDTYTYNIVINAWARSRQDVAGKNAERLLREMQRKTEEGNKKVAPNLVTYNAAINAWSKGTNSRSPEDAERLLRELIDMSHGNVSMKPDKITFHAVMNAYAKEGKPKRTEFFLAEMKLRGGSCTPDAESLRLCMEAWARSGLECCGMKCDEYLEQLEKLYPNELSHHLEMRYKSAHIAWMSCLKQGNPKAAERLNVLTRTLSEIQRMETRPVWHNRNR